MSKFKEKLKGFGQVVKKSAKTNPKLFGTVVALIVVATGGSAGTAAGILELTDLLTIVGDTVGVLTTE